jgi:hypothetical protein
MLNEIKLKTRISVSDEMEGVSKKLILAYLSPYLAGVLPFEGQGNEVEYTRHRGCLCPELCNKILLHWL